MSYIIVLHEDAAGNPPDGNDASNYAKAVKVKIPVTVDPVASVVLKTTPWNGMQRPGKCVLSPAMEMLNCYVGENDTAGFNTIKQHAGL